MLDRLIGIADALAAGGTGAGGGDDPSAQAEEQPGIDRRRVGHHLHIGGGRDTGGALVVEHGPEGADGIRAADGGAVGDAGTPVGEHRVVQQPRLRQCQLGGDGGKRRDPPHGAGLLARVVRRQREVRDGGRQPGVETVVDGPLRHADHRIAPRLQSGTHARPVLPKGRYPGHAGDDYPFHTMPPLMEMTCRVT
ncbi:hypothetical protein D3C76_1208690 [compost metagenome]